MSAPRCKHCTIDKRSADAQMFPYRAHLFKTVTADNDLHKNPQLHVATFNNTAASAPPCEGTTTHQYRHICSAFLLQQLKRQHINQ